MPITPAGRSSSPFALHAKRSNLPLVDNDTVRSGIQNERQRRRAVDLNWKKDKVVVKLESNSLNGNACRLLRLSGTEDLAKRRRKWKYRRGGKEQGRADN